MLHRGARMGKLRTCAALVELGAILDAHDVSGTVRVCCCEYLVVLIFLDIKICIYHRLRYNNIISKSMIYPDFLL